MNYSQNGYSVIEREDCRFYDDIVDGVSIPLRPDACGEVLAQFSRDFAEKVEPLGRTETFGHNKRQISGTDEWSNHASGTAVDLNASQHAYGKTGTFTVNEVFAIRELLDEYDDVIRWGGNYNGTKDEMHFEIDKPYPAVKLLASVIKRDGEVRLSRLEPGNRNLDVYILKRAMKDKGVYGGKLNKYFGTALRKAYRNWQESLGYTGDAADGIPGPASLAALGLRVKEG